MPTARVLSAAVLLVDYFITRRSGRDYLAIENFYDPRGAFGCFGVPGLTALIVGIIVSIPFMAIGLYTGPIAQQMNRAEFSYFVGALVAAVIYFTWAKRSRGPLGVAATDKQTASAADLAQLQIGTLESPVVTTGGRRPFRRQPFAVERGRTQPNADERVAWLPR